jgi:hypothetical protein
MVMAFVGFANVKGQELIVLQDGHSKWPEVTSVANTSAIAVTEALRFIFATSGLPEELTSDNGPPFNSVAFAEFLKNYVRHKLTYVYHPSSNGQIERGVWSLKLSLQKQLLDSHMSDRTLQHLIRQLVVCVSQHATYIDKIDTSRSVSRQETQDAGFCLASAAYLF